MVTYVSPLLLAGKKFSVLILAIFVVYHRNLYSLAGTNLAFAIPRQAINKHPPTIVALRYIVLLCSCMTVTLDQCLACSLFNVTS